MKVLFVPCSNGFGHLNRTLLLIQWFISAGDECSLYASKSDLKILLQSNADFRESVDVDCLDKKLPPKDAFLTYSQSINDIIFDIQNVCHRYDLVVTDNHIELLSLPIPVILSANFFWDISWMPDPLVHGKSIYFKFCQQLVRRSNSICISSKLFSYNIHYLYSSPFYIDLIARNSSLGNQDIKPGSPSTRQSILVSAGRTDAALEIAYKVVTELITNSVHLNFQIFIEPRLFSKVSWPSNVCPATYDQMMYEKLIFAFIRPGLSTLVECLSNFVLPICFYETDSFELMHNAQSLLAAGLGLNYQKSLIDDPYLSFLNNNLNKFYATAGKLSFKGAKQFRQYSLDFLSADSK